MLSSLQSLPLPPPTTTTTTTPTTNSLSGTLPKAIASANFLTQLRLGSNRFSGSVPLAINTLSHLAELDLSDNIGLTGTLPSMK